MTEIKRFNKVTMVQLPQISESIQICIDKMKRLPYPYFMAAIKDCRENNAPLKEIIERHYNSLSAHRETAAQELLAISDAKEKTKSKSQSRAEALEARYSAYIMHFSECKIPAELIADFLSKLDLHAYPTCAYTYPVHGIKKLIKKLSGFLPAKGTEATGP